MTWLISIPCSTKNGHVYYFELSLVISVIWATCELPLFKCKKFWNSSVGHHFLLFKAFVFNNILRIVFCSKLYVVQTEAGFVIYICCREDFPEATPAPSRWGSITINFCNKSLCESVVYIVKFCYLD